MAPTKDTEDNGKYDDDDYCGDEYDKDGDDNDYGNCNYRSGIYNEYNGDNEDTKDGVGKNYCSQNN